MKSAAALVCIVLLFFSMRTDGAVRITVEGTVPLDVNFLSINSEYNRICRALAPNRNPDPSPLKILYYSKAQKNTPQVSLPEWGGGGAVGCDLIVIPTDFKPFLQQSFSQITVHELVHVALCRTYRGLEIPRWFHEGAAMMLSGEISSQENIVISTAIFTSRLMPLASIDSVNGFGRGRADIAYSLSHLAVLYLTDNYGREALSEILKAARPTNNFWAGMYAVLGLTPGEFEQSVVKYITSRYSLVFLITDTYAWWLALALLFIAGYIVTRIRNRKRAEEMELQEQQEQLKLQTPKKPEQGKEKKVDGGEDEDDELEDWEIEEEEP